MELFRALNVSASGLHAHRRKMDVIAENLANTETTRTEAGGPYRRKMVVFEAKPVESFAPPMMTFQFERSTSLATGLVTIICSTVGTQWEAVTLSPTMSLSSMAGSYLPG